MLPMKSSNRQRKPTQTPSKKIIIISTCIGFILGVIYWYFVTRCDDESCFYHYVPTMELLAFGLLGWVFPFVRSEYIREKKKRK